MAATPSITTPTSLPSSRGTNDIPTGTQLSYTEVVPAQQATAGAATALSTPGPAPVQVSTTASQSRSLIEYSTSTPTARGAAPQQLNVTGMRVWSGRVLEVEDDIFTAELTPYDHHGPTVLADFDANLLDADEPVQSGDLFYLKVRTIRERGRRVSRTSNLLLRRLGEWSQEELDQAAREATSEFRIMEDFIE